jgi:F-type H+-transporting ATPase subunit epsilon
MAEVQPTIVTVLADAAENVADIDITRAQAAKKRAEDALANLKPEDHDAYLRMEAALRRSNLRLDAVRRHRRTRDTYTEQDASL